MVKCPIHTDIVIKEDVNCLGYFCVDCQKYYTAEVIYYNLLNRYYQYLNKYSMNSHKNQLIQECAELIYNITKQKQRELNGEFIESSILENYPKELMHVKLIIDYLLFNDIHLNSFAKDAFIELCIRRKIKGV